MAPESTPILARRDRLHEVIFGTESRAGRTFDIALIIAILASVVVVVISTLPAVREEPWKSIFFALEWCFTVLFTIEYVTRLAIARRPFRYAISFFGIIDLLSILPAFIGLFVGGAERLMVVRTLRLLRLFRVFKLARYLSEATALRQALYDSRHKLGVFITTVVIVLVIMSAVMHVVEGNAGNEAFDSMPEAMYWGVITMTTVGYGDVTPTTALGKLATAVLVLFGYSLIIVPTGVITAEITAPARARQRIIDRACPSCGAGGHEEDASYCKKCGERLTGSVVGHSD